MSGAIGIDLEQFGKQIGKAVNQKKTILFFLGAGCSWPAIPLARDIVNKLRRETEGESPLSSYEQLNYEHDVTRLVDTDSDRQEHFSSLCKNVKPTRPQTEFAKLIDALQKNEQVPVILTTNFDLLLERALGMAGIDRDVCDLDGDKLADLQSMLKMAKNDGRPLVVNLLGSVKGGRAVHFNMQNGGEVGKALAAILPATTRVVVAGYSGAESGVATMFSALFGDGALSPKNLYWCTAPNEGPPYEDPRNVVFSTMKEKHSKWVRDTSFAAAIVQLGDNSRKLADDVAEANIAAAALTANITAAIAAIAASDDTASRDHDWEPRAVPLAESTPGDKHFMASCYPAVLDNDRQPRSGKGAKLSTLRCFNDQNDDHVVLVQSLMQETGLTAEVIKDTPFAAAVVQLKIGGDGTMLAGDVAEVVGAPAAPVASAAAAPSTMASGTSVCRSTEAVSATGAAYIAISGEAQVDDCSVQDSQHCDPVEVARLSGTPTLHGKCTKVLTCSIDQNSNHVVPLQPLMHVANAMLQAGTKPEDAAITVQCCRGAKSCESGRLTSTVTSRTGSL